MDNKIGFRPRNLLRAWIVNVFAIKTIIIEKKKVAVCGGGRVNKPDGGDEVTVYVREHRALPLGAPPRSPGPGWKPRSPLILRPGGGGRR